MDRPPFGQDLAVREAQRGKFLVLHVEEEELTAANAPVFQAHLVHRIAAGNHHIILDLSSVEAIDQAGIDAMRTGLQAVGADGDLVLCGITEPVMETLRRTLMNRVFGIFLGPDEAVDALT
jgi:anti-anti-sigma factor